MARHRRFIDFTDEELKIMQDSIAKEELQKEIKEEFKTREYNRKRYEEWASGRPKHYAC